MTLLRTAGQGADPHRETRLSLGRALTSPGQPWEWGFVRTGGAPVVRAGSQLSIEAMKAAFMRARAFRRGRPRAARRLAALLIVCPVMSAPWLTAAADGGRVFTDPLATPPKVTVQQVLGTYRRPPVESGWHSGPLTLEPGPAERRVWPHTVGASWALTADLVNQGWIAGPDTRRVPKGRSYSVRAHPMPGAKSACP